MPPPEAKNTAPASGPVVTFWPSFHTAWPVHALSLYLFDSLVRAQAGTHAQEDMLRLRGGASEPVEGHVFAVGDAVEASVLHVSVVMQLLQGLSHAFG